ncbi:MAG: hypothetical protein CL947_01920 [Epsilonproteobacteria bacterium]|nr:hypothetical protein [Campylobacterota bacterium]|tara:strand:- start:539 stop:1012 length:474 start_codon:yes stop_codon:yes gene_type:complete
MTYLSLPIIKAGIFAGIVMGIFAMAVNMIKLTTLNLTEYMGCMATGKKAGNESFIAGFSIHIIASALFPPIYLHIMQYFTLPLTLHTGIILGLGHTVIAGILLGYMDNYNICVKKKKIQAMHMFAQGHGNAGVATYLIAHVIYAMAVMYFLGAPLAY